MNSIKGLVAVLGVAALTLTGVACSSGEPSTTRDTSSSAILFENASGNTVAPQAPDEPDTEPDVVRQDESSAQAPDIVLTAKQTGLPVESVERAIAFQQAFGKYVDELIVRFPDQISAVWTEPFPNMRGHVQFIGEVPPDVTSEVERQGLLDPNNVVLSGGGMFLIEDHSRLAGLAAEALKDLGYRNFVTNFDPIDNVIQIELMLPEGVSQPSRLDLVGPVLDRLQADRAQSGEARFQGRAVDALDLELTVITGSGPIVTLDIMGGVIEGTVVDAQGRPVAGMRVGIVSGTAAFPEIAPETDEQGYYQIGSVAPGTFQVSVHDRDGQRVSLESVVVKSGETATLKFSVSAGAAAGKQGALPPRPVMRLWYAGQVYDGAEGSYCWPDYRTDDGSVVGLCVDKFRWDGLSSAIPVEEGSSFTLEVEAEEQAQALSAAFYELDSRSVVRFVELGSGSKASLPVDLPEGVYNMAVFGRWPDGDLTYEFRIEVRPEFSAPPLPEGQSSAGLSGGTVGDTAPPILHGDPGPNLTYEGAVYYLTPLSDDDAANLNEDDLELVGSTTESNLLLPAGSEIRRFIVDLNHDNPELTLSEIKDRVEAKFQIGLDKSMVGRNLRGLNIYKLKDGEEGYLYTLEPGQSFLNEDGTTITFEAEWQRWVAADSSGT